MSKEEKDEKKALLIMAIRSDEGKRIEQELYTYMVELSSHSNANSEWLKGLGMFANHLKTIDEQNQ